MSGFDAAIAMISSHLFHLKQSSFELDHKQKSQISNIQMVINVFVENIPLFILQCVYLASQSRSVLSGGVSITLLSMMFSILSMFTNVITIVSRIWNGSINIRRNRSDTNEMGIKFDLSSKDMNGRHRYTHVLITKSMDEVLKHDQSKIKIEILQIQWNNATTSPSIQVRAKLKHFDAACDVISELYGVKNAFETQCNERMKLSDVQLDALCKFDLYPTPVLPVHDGYVSGDEMSGDTINPNPMFVANSASTQQERATLEAEQRRVERDKKDIARQRKELDIQRQQLQQKEKKLEREVNIHNQYQTFKDKQLPSSSSKKANPELNTKQRIVPLATVTKLSATEKPRSNSVVPACEQKRYQTNHMHGTQRQPTIQPQQIPLTHRPYNPVSSAQRPQPQNVGYIQKLYPQQTVSAQTQPQRQMQTQPQLNPFLLPLTQRSPSNMAQRQPQQMESNNPMQSVQRQPQNVQNKINTVNKDVDTYHEQSEPERRHNVQTENKPNSKQRNNNTYTSRNFKSPIKPLPRPRAPKNKSDIVPSSIHHCGHAPKKPVGSESKQPLDKKTFAERQPPRDKPLPLNGKSPPRRARSPPPNKALPINATQHASAIKTVETNIAQLPLMDTPSTQPRPMEDVDGQMQRPQPHKQIQRPQPKSLPPISNTAPPLATDKRNLSQKNVEVMANEGKRKTVTLYHQFDRYMVCSAAKGPRGYKIIGFNKFGDDIKSVGIDIGWKLVELDGKDVSGAFYHSIKNDVCVAFTKSHKKGYLVTFEAPP